MFTDLGLDPALLKALDGEGYSTPTPIQAQAIPTVMAGRDLLGIAQTGTGKTAAFALPILHRLAANRRQPLRKGCRVLVLSPTRELASQIAESFKTYGRHIGVTVAVVFGGVAHKPQRDALLRGVDVLVATPGRLLDLMGERTADISGTEIFVLDEADQMLDLGFVQPIRRIVKHLSQRRQNLFFSATMPQEIGKLAGELLIEPARVAVTPVATTVERVTQRVIHIDRARKVAVLGALFADPAIARALVFTRTKRGADRVAKKLESMGVPVASIHGNKSQKQREIALEAFKRSRIRALVATDIAARGIDVDGVTHVINFELPNVPESYVHRIGRTARAGAEGIAISLCEGEERAYLKDIERLIRQTIPAEDRRNDASLAAEPARPAPHARSERQHELRRDDRRERPASGPRRSHEGRPRNAEAPHGRGRDEHRRDRGQRPARPEHPRRDRSDEFRNELGFGEVPRPPGARDNHPQNGRSHERGHNRPHEQRDHGQSRDGHRSGGDRRQGDAGARHVRPAQPARGGVMNGVGFMRKPAQRPAYGGQHRPHQGKPRHSSAD